MEFVSKFSQYKISCFFDEWNISLFTDYTTDSTTWWAYW